MTPPRPEQLQQLLDQLYQHFDTHPHVKDFCQFCWSEAEVDYINACPVRELSSGMAQKLLWEASDHWPSVDVYQYYLPRMPEALAPPESLETLYPLHLFEVLKRHQFHSWKAPGKTLVRDICHAVTPIITFMLDEDLDEWQAGLKYLDDPLFELPASSPDG